MKKVAKIILLNNKNEFLFQLRDNIQNIVCPDQWALIGGGMDSNEKAIKSLQRELQEEIPDCRVKNIRFVGQGYAEFNPDNILVGYSMNNEYKIRNPKNLIHHVSFFKGRIDEKIEYINEKLTEGQRAAYFKLDELENIKLNKFEKNFIYFHKKEIFS